MNISAHEILTRLGLDMLNPMQQETMQALRRHSSLVLLSPTGSGKTLAYLLPLFEELDERSADVQALVIVPSRELAQQTQRVVKDCGTALRSCALYGGRPTMDEHRMLQGTQPQLVVGTPGRLLDHLRKGNLKAETVRTVVLDEFDKCLEMGFRDEMEQIFSFLKGVSKRVLLSATDNAEITRFLPDYHRLDYLSPDESTSGIMQQFVVRSPEKDKLGTLRSLLLSRGEESSLVFVGYRESVERVAKFLRQGEFHVAQLHGGMEQKQREAQLYRFIGGSANVLVCTDLASRGLDIPELHNVIHYHLPLDEQSFVHRNGRTARWDKTGNSFLILGPEESLPTYVAEHEVWDNPIAPEEEADMVPTLPRWETLYIGKGKKDKLSRGDIAGFLMKVGGLQRDELGRIDVKDLHSYASVLRAAVRNLLPRIRGQKIKGIKTIIEPMR